jgi:hypothetical protein
VGHHPQAFKKSPQSAIIGSSNLESATMEKECGMWQQSKHPMGALNGLRQDRSPNPEFTTTPTTFSPLSNLECSSMAMALLIFCHLLLGMGA